MTSSLSKRRNYLNFSQTRRILDDDHENLSHRSIPKHNLVCWLRDRELGYTKSRINHSIAQRTHVYRAIHPSYSILMCTVPQAVYIRRFSPNGKYLLAFSHDLESLIVYRYKGKSVYLNAFYR
jgi:de-etiolated-1